MKTELKYLLASKFLTGIVSGFLIVALPLYLANRGYSLQESGYLYGSALLCYAFLTLYFGSSSEVSGRRWIGIVAILGMVASLIFFGMSAFVPLAVAGGLLIAGKILLNCCESLLFSIAKMRVLDLSVETQFGKDFGLFLTGVSLGSGMGMLLGAAMVALMPYFLVFFLCAGLLLIGLVFFRKSGDLADKKGVASYSFWKEFRRTTGEYKALLLMNTFVVGPMFAVDFFALPLFQKDILGMADWQIFLLFGTSWIIYGLLTMSGGKAFDRYGVWIFCVACFFIGITSIMLAYATSLWWFAAILIADYVFFAFADPGRFALMGKVSQKNKGMLVALGDFAYLVVSALMIFFLGVWVEHFGFESLFFVRGAGQFGAIALVLYVVYRKRSSRQQSI